MIQWEETIPTYEHTETPTSATMRRLNTYCTVDRPMQRGMRLAFPLTATLNEVLTTLRVNPDTDVDALGSSPVHP